MRKIFMVGASAVASVLLMTGTAAAGKSDSSQRAVSLT